MTEKVFTIPHSHPSLVGHFPGNPIVPGVLILEQVENAITGEYPNLLIKRIGQVKFLKPLLPGQEVKMELQGEKEGTITFTCYFENKKIANGTISIEER